MSAGTRCHLRLEAIVSRFDVVNPDADTSIEALSAWIASLEREDDWIDLPTTAAELIAEDRATHGS